jgi:hypothetical protein
MQQGLLGRISRSAVMEYHAFGTISEGKHAKYHYLICGVQGDFTRGLVNDMPKAIWTRELKVSGSLLDYRLSLLTDQSSQVCLTPHASTNEEFDSARELVWVLRCQHVSRVRTGSSSG